MTPKSYAESVGLTRTPAQEWAEAREREASAALKAVADQLLIQTGRTRDASGLLPAVVIFHRDYRQAKRQWLTTFAALQRANRAARKSKKP